MKSTPEHPLSRRVLFAGAGTAGTCGALNGSTAETAATAPAVPAPANSTRRESG